MPKPSPLYTNGLRRRVLLRSLVLECVFGFVMYLNIFQPMLQKYYMQNGLSQFGVSCMIALYTAVVLVHDVVTGNVGDTCGYKFVRQLGTVPLCLGFLTLYLSHSLLGMGLGVILWGLGAACMRGASDANAKRCAELLGGQKDWYRWFTNYSITFMGLGEAVGALFAWQITKHWVVGDDPRIVALWQCFIFASAFVLLQGIEEEGRRSARSRLQDLATLLVKGWGDLGRKTRHVLIRPALRDALAFTAVLSATTSTMVGLSLANFEAAHLSLVAVALVWAMYHVWWALTPFLAKPYELWLGRGRALATLPPVAAVTYVLLAIVPAHIGLYITGVFFFIRTLQMSIMRHYVVSIAPPDQRGLVASMVTTAQLAFAVIMNIVLGLIAQYFSLRYAFVASAVVYGPLGVWLVWRMRQHQAAV